MIVACYRPLPLSACMVTRARILESAPADPRAIGVWISQTGDLTGLYTPSYNL